MIHAVLVSIAIYGITCVHSYALSCSSCIFYIGY